MATKRAMRASRVAYFLFLFLLRFCPWNVAALGDTTAEQAPPAIVQGPPYFVIQIGEPRSGSTFQFQLLSAIVALKLGRQAAENNATFKGGLKETRLRQEMAQNRSFVIKTHKPTDEKQDAIERLQQEGHPVVVFASSRSDENWVDYAIYHQRRANLEKCSMCEIDYYQEYFGLTPKELQQVKDHMTLYQVIRQCCGFQMSKYEVMRLNGCDMTEYNNQPDNPHCERHNVTDIELQFHESPIYFHQAAPQFNWAKPGDCARLNSQVASGRGFNDRKFRGCGD